MNRWSQYQFNNGKTARNRIVVPPMASQTADELGFATPSTWKHYQRLAQSGAGIIFVEYSYIHPSGKGEPNQLGVHLDSQIEGLKKISESLQSSGALSGLQIVHVGGKSNSQLTGSLLIGPSSVPTPVKGQVLETPNEATPSMINNLIEWYLESAGRAEKAGFDIVELHAAHGYGLNQWLSPLTNLRDDEYGGDITGRSLLLRKLATLIKQQHPQLLLAVRLPAQDHLPGGLHLQEMNWVVSELEKIGVDLIDVSSGIGGWKRPEGRLGQGYLVGDAEILKRNTQLPVIGVGGIQSGEFIDQIIAEEKVDFAAVGRAILESPADWIKHHLKRFSLAL